jgi:hypothetical protein
MLLSPLVSWTTIEASFSPLSKVISCSAWRSSSWILCLIGQLSGAETFLKLIVPRQGGLIVAEISIPGKFTKRGLFGRSCSSRILFAERIEVTETFVGVSSRRLGYRRVDAASSLCATMFTGTFSLVGVIIGDLLAFVGVHQKPRLD